MQRARNAMTEEELRDWAVASGFPAYRGSQLFHFLHVERGTDLDAAHVLPQAVRAAAGALGTHPLTAELVRRSEDGSAKYLYRLFDGAHIETVYMPYEDRTTLCVSSQVGCRMGCSFCASTKAPFGRNLGADEILEQVYQTERAEGRTIDHIVLMGIGEPLDNLDEVLRFIRLVTDPKGKGMSARNITLSTSGLVPGIYRLIDEAPSITLAISLHATSDERRARTMPVARRYSIAEILKATDAYFDATGRRVSFEYVLIRGENDREEDIRWMAQHMRGAGRHVNLIPLNRIDEFDQEAADRAAMEHFAASLEKAGVHVSVRHRRGADIDAACGQLRVLYEGVGGRA
ncbi:MAG: 23S rRNA (adenine(2503)-C(2))-methyltransferase RlmN [Peptoniphilaceae bacterium]|nr:23S rRNA (adenine(2503)-C(2))-methyltransferase RlmN [Peptoniphilaceae bacterium]MDY6085590.1 23S rRNA (adenine(2503)-C(2))-methyltransferase RlmN [Peptoniphilaceae bacterium]